MPLKNSYSGSKPTPLHLAQPTQPTEDPNAADVWNAQVKGFGEGAAEGFQNIRGLLGGGVRVASGIGGSIPAMVPGVGTAIGAGIGGAGEAAAELIEGSKLNPARIGVEAGLTAVPLGKVYQTGKVAQSALRGLGYTAAGMIGRRLAEDQPVLPTTAGGAAMDVGSLGLGAGLGAFLGMKPRTLNPVSHEDVMNAMEGEIARRKAPPPPPPPSIPPVKSEKYEIVPTAQTGFGTGVLTKQGKIQSRSAMVIQPRTPKDIKFSGTMPTTAPEVVTGESGRIPYGAAAEVTPATPNVDVAQKQESNKLWAFGEDIRNGLSKALNKAPNASSALDDLDAAIQTERKSGGEIRNRNFRMDTAAKRAEDASDFTNLKNMILGKAAANKAQEGVITAERAAAEVEASKAGLNPTTTVTETVKAPTELGSKSAVTRWMPDEAAAPTSGGAVDPGTNLRQPTSPPTTPPPAKVPAEPFNTPRMVTQPEAPAAPYDPIAADAAKADALVKPVPTFDEAGRGQLPDTPVEGGVNQPQPTVASSTAPADFGQLVNQVEKRPELAGTLLTKPVPAGMRYRLLKNLLSNEKAAGNVIPDEASVAQDLEQVRSQAKGRPSSKLTQPTEVPSSSSSLEGSPASAGASGEAIDNETLQGLLDLEAAQKGKGVTPGSIANIPSQMGVNETDKTLSTEKGIAQTAKMRAAAAAKRQAGKFGGNEAGEINPQLLSRLGLGLGGAVVGAAADSDHPVRGALIGGAAGIGGAVAIEHMPAMLEKLGAAPEAVGNLVDDLKAPGGIQQKAQQIWQSLPQIQRFNYLFDAMGLPANALAGPLGSLGMGALEHGLSGDPRGWSVLKEVLSDPRILVKEYRDAIPEASARISMGDIGRGETGAGLTGIAQDILQAPGKAMTAGDIAVKNILARHGFSDAESQAITLTGEAEGNFMRRLQELPKGSTVGGMMFPFSRTPVNIAEQGGRRLPGVGVAAQALRGEKADPLRTQVVQQLLGAGVGGGSYLLGSSLSPEAGRNVSRFVSNLGGQYSLPASVGFAIGQAKSQGRANPIETGVTEGITRGLPVPTTEPVVELKNMLFHGKLPRGAMPPDVRRLLESAGVMGPDAVQPGFPQGPKAPTMPTGGLKKRY